MLEIENFIDSSKTALTTGTLSKGFIDNVIYVWRPAKSPDRNLALILLQRLMEKIKRRL